MYIEICLPYSLKEVFNAEVRDRLNDLRAKAVDLYQGDRKSAWKFICTPHALHNGKSLLELSEASQEGHEQALYRINCITHGLPV